MAEIKYVCVNPSEIYSDGDVEKDILEAVKSHPDGDYRAVLQTDRRWPVFYHLTPMRENILNWYDFTPGCSVLEIGAGMGALTGLLCDRAKSVTAVELTRQRAEILYRRHQSRENLTVLAGNFNGMEFSEKFDYITLIGVLEYASGFTPGGDPADFLKAVRGLLKPGGKLLIAIENRYGLKYWCGANEDHTGTPYSGINGYPDRGDVRTYSRNALERLLREAGLSRQRFFYPMPDYKLPQALYSDDYLPKERLSEKVKQYYLDQPALLADEGAVYQDVAANGAFPFLANSFFVECGGEDAIPSSVTFASFTPYRKPDYQVVTVFRTDGTVEKQAAGPQGLAHLRTVEAAQSRFLGGALLPYHRAENGALSMAFINAPSLAEILRDALRRSDVSEAKVWLDRFYSAVKRSSNAAEGKDGLILQDGFLDMTFANCFVVEGALRFFDQEWVEESVPASFILFRAIRTFYVENPALEEVVPRAVVLGLYFSQEEQLRGYERREQAFLTKVEPPQEGPAAFFAAHGAKVDAGLLTRAKEGRCFGALYFDLGDGYTQARSMPFSYDPALPLRIRCAVPDGTVSVRIDPVDGQFCIVRHLEAVSDCGLLSCKNLNGIEAGTLSLFATTDPQFEAALPPAAQWISVQAEVFCFDHPVLLALQNDYACAREVAENDAALEAANGELTAQKLALEAANGELTARTLALEAANGELTARTLALETAAGELTARTLALETATGELTAQTLALEADKARLAETLAQSRGEVLRLSAQYAAISDAQCWKMTAPLRRLLDALKRTALGRNLHKTAHSLRVVGPRATWQKILVHLAARPTTDAPAAPEGGIGSFAALAQAVTACGGAAFGFSAEAAQRFQGAKKRVVLVSHELNLTGAPVALGYLAQSLLRQGIAPLMISPRDGALRQQLCEDGIPILIHEQVYSSELVEKSRGLFDLIVVCTNVGAPLIARLNGCDTPVMWWIHEAHVSYHPGALEAMPQRLSENIHVYCGGPYAADVLAKYRPSYRCKQLLYYVPDYAQKLSAASPSVLPDTQGKTVFAIVGTQEQRKGQDVLVDAVRLLPEELLSQCLFVFVGRAFYPPIEKAISSLRGEKPLHVLQIEELGRQELTALYQQMDCLVCASRDDPMPIVVTEAMLMSKPIICSEHAGSAALLTEMDSGLIYRDDDPGQLAEQIAFICAQSREALRPMCQRARKTYERYFSQTTFDDAVKEMVLQTTAEAEPLSFDGTVSVVIPAYNAGKELKPLLKLLNDQTGVGRMEIILVDSGSTDGTAENAEALGTTVIRITQQEFSHSHARNLGASHAAGEYILFMTQDAVPDGTDWVSNLLQPCLRQGAVAVSCREEPKPGCDLLGRVSIWLHSEYMGILSDDRMMQMPESPDYNRLRRNGQLNDVTCLVKRSVFADFGYRGDYAEDLDLGIRLIQSGYRLALLSRTRVIHSHTRPAFYYLKRCLVDSRTLKRILPDIPMENPSAQTVKNRLIAAYGLLVRYGQALDRRLDAAESLPDFCAWTKSCFLQLRRELQAAEVAQWEALIQCEISNGDQELQAFAAQLVSDCGASFTPDFSSAGVEFDFISKLLPRYLTETGEGFGPAMKREISVLLMKYFGQTAGNLLAAYSCHRSGEDALLDRMVEAYCKGV